MSLRFDSTANLYNELFPSEEVPAWYSGGLLGAFAAKFSKSGGSGWSATDEQQMKAVALDIRNVYEESVHPVFCSLTSLDDVCDWFESDSKNALHFGSELMYAMAFLAAKRFDRASALAAECLARNKKNAENPTGTLNILIRDSYQRACAEIIKRAIQK